ncbi:MAG TPA: hypothetical protein VF062_22435 [Candidatus Limnocylindrales bacterium]
MGTRALFTVTLLDGSEPFRHYRRWDGYPDAVLPDLAAALAVPGLADALAAARRVDQLATPTPEDRIKYSDWAEQVSAGPDREYYALLRKQQGDLAAMTASGIIVTTDGPIRRQAFDYLVDFPAGTVTVAEDGGPKTVLSFDQLTDEYAHQ